MILPAKTTPAPGGKELTQHGLNTVLYRLIKDMGGQLVIKHAELEALPPKCVLVVNYDKSQDTFILRCNKLKESIIIGGGTTVERDRS